MMPSNLNWSCRVTLLLFVIFSLAACASYPDGPRSPQTADDTYTLEEDSFLNVPVEKGVLINDKPKEGTRSFLLTVGEMSTDNGGILNMAEDGSFTYEPAANFTGTDQATYTIRNEKGKESDGTVFFEITPLNDPPQPVDDHAQTDEGEPVTIDLLGNDLEPDGDPLAVIDVGIPSVGTILLNNDGTLIYTPQAGHSGDVAFYYTVSDDNGEEAAAWIFVTVVAVDSGVAVLPDTLSVVEDGILNAPLSTLLANDRDLENGAPLTVIELGEAQHGTTLLNGDGTLTYTPVADFSGVDTFTYTVQSQSGSTASATVTVNVIAVPDAPSISDIADISIAQGTATDAIEFTINDPDTPLADLIVTAEVTSALPLNLVPDGGIVISSGVNATRTIRITPTANLYGTATITVTVSDGQFEASDAFILTVTPANAPPTISPIADQTTQQNTPITVNFTVADAETPPVALIVSAVSNNQTLVPNTNIAAGGIGANRNIVITPAVNQIGSATITISVRDGSGADAQTTQLSFLLTVAAAANTPPTISAIADQRTPMNTQMGFVFFTVNDAETDPSNLAVSATSSNQLLLPDANITVSTGSTLRYITATPAVNQLGTTTITVSVNDGTQTVQTSFLLEVYSTDILTDNSVSINSLSSSLTGNATLLSSSSTGTTVSNISYTISEDNTLAVSAANGVLGNDADMDRYSYRVISTQNMTSHFGGEVLMSADGSFTYMPVANFNGVDFFSYTISPVENTNTQIAGQVIINVTAVNDGPLAEDDIYTATPGRTLILSASEGVLANDRDAENDTLRVIPLQQTNLTINSGGGLTYTPPAGFVGRQMFNYTVSDGRRSTIARLTIVVGGNQVPNVRQDDYTTVAGKGTAINASAGLLANDVDPDGQHLTVTSTGVFETLLGGEVNIQSNGGFIYRSPSNLGGFDSFTYTVSDGEDLVTGIAEISVSP